MVSFSNRNKLRRRKMLGPIPETPESPEEGDAPEEDNVKNAVEEFTKKHPTKHKSKNHHKKSNSTTSSNTTKTPFPPSPWISWLWLLLHSISWGIYIAGWILQQHLHTSVECEMTYSRRQLIPIPMTRTSSKKYSLHKFVDQRDPRPHHKQLLQNWLPIVQQVGNDEQVATNTFLSNHNHNNQHCSPTPNDTVTVLYIPGHWGSYMQARSIGAHGIQLTAAQDYQQTKKVAQGLAQPDYYAGVSAQSLPQFTFDVYAVNYQEEGAALHAKFLWQQTEFVVRVIQELVDTCQLSQVVLLGHSMGGYVARLAPALYPEIRPYISNIITLGSPHASPVFGWEPTIRLLHQTYLQETTKSEKDLALVAISGGLRDEMIPPVACQASHGLSILSPEIMEVGPHGAQPQFGMDHRAIVWCHNLLSVVRKVIFTLVRQDNQDLSPTDRVHVVQSSLGLPDGNYKRALDQNQIKFRTQHGFITTLALESSMLYHLELLVGLFVVLGCFHSIGTHINGYDVTYLHVLATACLAANTNYQIQLLGILALTFVANSIFQLLNWLVSVALPSVLCSGGISKLSKHLKQVQIMAVGIFLITLGLQLAFKMFGWQARLCLALLFAVWIGTIATTIAISSYDRHSTKFVSFAITFFLFCPFLVAGKIMALLSESTVDNLPGQYNPERALLILSAKLLLPILCRVTYHHCLDSSLGDLDEKMRAFHLTLVILYFSRTMFQIGQGYRAGDMLVIFSWLECFFLPILL